MTFTSQLSAAFTPIGATYDTDSVIRALTWAQSFVESYCDQIFDLVTNDVVFLDPKPYRAALLPQVPVVSVSDVQALLPPQTPIQVGLVWTELTNYRFVALTGLIYDTSGEPNTAWTVGINTWPWVAGGLQVTYDHGYVTIPQPLIDVACRFAAQYLENPASVLQRRVGEVEERFSGSAGLVINALDQRILDRYTDIGIA